MFTGVSGSQTLRTVLSQLDPKQQALVLGYAVPMPVVVRTRPFDKDFYKAISQDPIEAEDIDSQEIVQKQAKQAKNELFGPG